MVFIDVNVRDAKDLADHLKLYKSFICCSLSDDRWITSSLGSGIRLKIIHCSGGVELSCLGSLR